MTITLLKPFTSEEKKTAYIADRVREILSALNCSDPCMEETPYRVARMYVDELFSSINKALPSLTTFPAGSAQGQIVTVEEIRVHSLCKHHLLPFHGTASISYIPNEKILGLSKINRLVDFCCKRPQLQEHLTAEIAHHLSEILQTKDVHVTIEAQHGCVCGRGIRDHKSFTRTEIGRGHFELKK